MWKKFDKKSAIYHTQSKIENFQFLITLRTISSLLKVPKFEKTSPSSASASMSSGETDLQEAQPVTDDEQEDRIEAVTIRWQQKILSRYEIEFYKEIENCTTDVQKGYHNWLKAGGGRLRSENKIFTYVQDDGFIPEEDPLLKDRQIHKRRITKLLRPFRADEEAEEDPEVMYIFADLDPDTLLFTVQWWKRPGRLVIYPDFNDYEKSAYFIEIDTDYRHLYSYSIQNLSKTKSVEIFRNLQLPKIWQIQKNLDKDFQMPLKRSTRVLFLFEIQEGQDFEYDNIHVRYRFDFPSFVQNEKGVQIGSTHSSQARHGTWKFGYSLQLMVICENGFRFHEPIRCFFEIISIDSWERERTEGFCHLLIPICAYTEQTRTLQCFRMDYGFLDKIERFFIGGRRKFQFDEFNKGADDFLNRFCSKVISTGILKVGFSLLLQRYPDFSICTEDKTKRCGMTLEDIVKAYQMARRRLEATIKEN